MGIPIEDNYMYSLLFTDDQVIMAGDEYDIEYMMRILAKSYEANGLKNNYSKIKYLVTGGKSKIFKYKGIQQKLKRRYFKQNKQAKQAIQKLNLRLWSGYIKRQNKRKIYNSIVQSILKFEILEMTKRDRERGHAVEMDFLRKE